MTAHLSDRSWTISLHLVLALFVIAGISCFAEAGWSQTTVSTICDLEAINKNLSGDYVLGTNVDASDFTCNKNVPFAFTPIGNNTKPFVGLFDGQGHTVSDLVSASTVFYSGLFGNVGPSGIVRNVGVTNASIKTGLIPGLGGGVLAGENEGTIEDAFATGAIDGGTYGSNVGGLVGTNSGQVIRSFANVAVSGKGIYSFGGLVGDNAGTGTITQSYATGSVFGGNANGGLVGLNLGEISQSYATGSVTGSGAVGGLVGNATGTTHTSYWDIQTSGQSQSAGGSPMNTKDLQKGLPSGFNQSVWSIFPTVSNPYLNAVRYAWLGFPIEGYKAQAFAPPEVNSATPIAPISAVMDHSGTPLDPDTSRKRCWYIPCEDKKVLAYTGELGDVPPYNCRPGPGYKNENGTPFEVNGNYVGARCIKTDPLSKTIRYLNYDGHSGYDYPFLAKTTAVRAAADGRLFKATVDNVNHNSSCLFNGWQEWHTFYIVHDNGYSSWYLHVDRLAVNSGDHVAQGQIVAYVGQFGPCGNPTGMPQHLHFEVRKTLPSGKDKDVVDPYAERFWLNQ